MFQQQRPQSANGSRPWTPNKPGGSHSANGNGVSSTHARPHQPQQQQQQQPQQRAFTAPPHARQLQPQSQARPSPPQKQQHHHPSNGAHSTSSGGKTVNFMSSSRGGDSDDDGGPQVDELLSSAALLPRTISFKKSAAAFSSSSAHTAASPNAYKLQAQSPHANGAANANGAAHRPATANGLSKSPAAATSSPFPRPPSHAGNNKLASPSAPGQQQLKAKHQQQNGAPRPGSSSASSLTVPVVHSKDPNQFRWPKKYLYPSTSVSALLNWNKFDKIGCGLSNLGNTCFLNAVLQALAYTPPLANYLRRGEHSKSCRVRTAKTPDQFCLFCALEQTCNSMASAKQSAIQPRLIVNHLRAISRSFRLGRQEDSHEFLRFVMEMLQKNDLAAYGGSALVKDIRIQETTALFGIFGGYFRSQVRCLSCHYCSNTFDAFLDLSLELAHVSSVAQALASFTRPEKLDADNLYNCSQCKKKVRAQKQLTIFKAPTVLCVHLKRFQFAQQFGGKINKPIDFRERLQLGPAMSDLASNPSYSLYAVLVHSGHSTNSGHYFCYVKSSSGQWHLMDDSSVRQVGLQHVLEQRAYILFYVRTAIETLPVAAPSPGMSPAVAPAAQAAMASKIAQLNLEASAKKFATTAAMAAHANGVVAKAKPAAAAAAAAEDDSYSEGDSDEGEEHVPAVKAKAKSPQVQPKAATAAAAAAPRAKPATVAAASAAEAQSDSDASMEEEDDEEIEEDEEIDSDSASMDDALYGSSAASGRGGVPARVRRHASRRTSRLNSLSLHLQPGHGGPPRFARCIYAFLERRAAPRKRRRIVEQDEDEDDDDDQSDDGGDAPMSDADAAPAAPAPAPKSSNRPAAEQATKRQKTDSNASNGPSKSAAVSAPAATAAAAAAPTPAPKPRFEPVYFNKTNTPPSPAPTPSPTPSVSSAAAAAAAPASSSAATPAKAAPAPTPAPTPAAAAPRASGPIIVSREAFDPRLLNRSYSSTQFGASVGDWETHAQADTSAKYLMKRKQDIANSKLVPQQKPKDQWDEELDKGHVRKTKTGKSTDLSADGYGATSGNMFQMAQNARNSKKADERAGIATPEKGRGGGDKSKQRGAQRGHKAKGFTTHKERNAQKKSGKGRKGPRDFSA